MHFVDDSCVCAQLLKSFPKSALPESPPKRLLRSFDPNYLRKKQASLERYMHDLLQVSGVMENSAMKNFVHLAQNVSPVVRDGDCW